MDAQLLGYSTSAVLTLIARQVMSELERLFKSELSAAVKTAAVTAVAAIAVSQDIDEEEEMRNKDIRKILVPSYQGNAVIYEADDIATAQTVTVVAAKGLIAADASGLSDPFAMIQLEPYDAAKEELNAFRCPSSPRTGAPSFAP